MDLEKTMIVAGLGCRTGVSEVEVLVAIRAALAAHGAEAGDLEALAVPEQKTDEPAIHKAANTLGLIVLVIGRAELQNAGERTLSRSDRSLQATGAPSASEAAALAALGPRGKLLGPRVAVGPVTCALASDGVLP
ncbi:cobalamin biosynthesis protein [Mesorhizobium sp. LHD-90]|uniref:cobalamin biosynthesis protein n=1 Tax=Mesorhizobium sp. LHD-90 TaxID=3071414 RepID=UPI0027E1DB95|nr:cobalamin biosynthesis protein [Mesorhizobium sp. LHD-90]MDQ6434426.1 cobalamin biosynthesis protein [Mesorhizobium sp. LHD-90]